MSSRLRSLAEAVIATWKVATKQKRVKARLTTVKNEVESFASKPYVEYQAALEACRFAAQRQLGELIDNADVRNLEKYGIKVDRLLQYGFHRIGLVNHSNEEALLVVPGIGKVKARQIARACELFAEETAARFRHAPDPANIRPGDIDTLKTLARYLKVSTLCAKELPQLNARIASIEASLRKTGRAWRELLADRDLRAVCLLDLDLANICLHELEQHSAKASGEYRNMQVSDEQVLKDFRADPQYFIGTYASMKIVLDSNGYAELED
jgi:hypothetical protein